VTRLVLGVGNPHAGDDGVGPAVIAALRADPPPGATLALAEPTDLPALLEGAAAAVIVDACRSGADPGALLRFDAADLPAGPFALSTHGLGLSAALALARALGALPPVCAVVAVEGRAFGPGDPMTPAVAAAVPAAARLARAALGAAP
jgi:hydrogenase maturation protease